MWELIPSPCNKQVNICEREEEKDGNVEIDE